MKSASPPKNRDTLHSLVSMECFFLVQVFSKPSAIQLRHWKITGRSRIHGERWKDKRPKYWWNIKRKQFIVTWRSEWVQLRNKCCKLFFSGWNENLVLSFFCFRLQIVDWMILSFVSLFVWALGSSSLVFITISKCNVLQMLGMMERDQDLKCGGHFLIMDTGHGKTVTSLLYAYRQQTWSRLVEKSFCKLTILGDTWYGIGISLLKAIHRWKAYIYDVEYQLFSEGTDDTNKWLRIPYYGRYSTCL